MIVDCTPELLHAVYPWFQAGRDVGRESHDALETLANPGFLTFFPHPPIAAAAAELWRRIKLEAP